MSHEPVDIFVTDQLGLPVEDVMVKIYNEPGTLIFTQATTDAMGKASFLLETQKYSARFYKFHTRFWQPVGIEVIPTPINQASPNVFDVVAEVFVPPAAEDPRLCVCSGYFRNLDGSAKRNLDIHFINQFEPVILEDAAIFAGELHIRTDTEGYAQVCLIRGANYTARIESQPGQDPRCVRVPDAASANLPDLLLPVVERVALDPTGPYALVAGGAVLVATPTVYSSDGVVLEGTAKQDVNWTSSDDTIFSVKALEETLELRGKVAGTAQLIAERHNKTIISIPDTPLEGQPIEVTVA